MASGTRRLNVASGLDYRPGWVNMDLNPVGAMKTDVNHNAFEFPWPFADDEFDVVLMSHFLEHVPHAIPGIPRNPFYPLFEEVYRVLKPNGKVVVRTPWWTRPSYWGEPTHCRVVHPINYSFLDPENPLRVLNTHAAFAPVEIRGEGWTTDWEDRFRIGKSGLGLTTHVGMRAPWLRWLVGGCPRELVAKLRAVKDPEELKRAEKIARSAPAPESPQRDDDL